MSLAPPPPLMSLALARLYALEGKPIRLTEWTTANQGITWPIGTISGINATTNVFTLVAHGFALNTPIKFSTAGVLPTLQVPDYNGLEGAEIDLDEYPVFAIPLTADTFKVTALPDFTQGVLDITAAGSGTLFVQRQTKREWLAFNNRFWWVLSDGSYRLSRATDLTAAEMSATNWTTLTEEEMAELAQGTNEVTPPGIDPDNADAGAEIGDPIIIDTAPGTATTIPEGGNVLDGDESATAGAASGGSGGGTTGTAGGSASAGGSGGGGDGNIIPAGGGAGGGGGGGGGGTPGGAPDDDVADDADDSGKASVTPALFASIVSESSQLLVADPLANGNGLSVRFMSFEVELGPLDYDTVKGSPFTTYLTTMDYNGKRKWSRWMHAGEEAQSFAGMMVLGRQKVVLEFKVRGPGGTKTVIRESAALDP